MKRAFTLAEVMITLTIIGVISAIVVPVAVNSRPNENVMKFKKAHNTLYQVINTLVTSDKYYLDGDLGKMPSGDYVSSPTYFCETFSDILSIKSKNCSGKSYKTLTGCDFTSGHIEAFEEEYPELDTTVTSIGNVTTVSRPDVVCRAKGVAPKFGDEIVTTDGIHYYESSAAETFGWTIIGTGDDQKNLACLSRTWDGLGLDGFTTYIDSSGNRHLQFNTGDCNKDLGKNPEGVTGNFGDTMRCDPSGKTFNGNPGVYIEYKIFCIDIDGTPEGATSTDCINECPFGYGIRRDGKIYLGARAREWLEKDIQGEN